MALLSTLVGEILKRRGPKPADYSDMVGRTFGSLKVTRIAEGTKQRHQIVDATCLVCGRKTMPRAGDVLAGNTKTCSCGQKKQYKEHKEGVALAYTTLKQRRAIFRYRIGRPLKFPFRFRSFKRKGPETKSYRLAKEDAWYKWLYRFSYSSRDARIAAMFKIPRDLIGPIVRLERRRLVGLYPSWDEMSRASDAGLISRKEYEFCINSTTREPIVLSLEDVFEAFKNGSGWTENFLHLLTPEQLRLRPA